MSHISTYALAVPIKNEDWLKKAIGLLEGQFRGIHFEQKGPDLIMVRYKGIEQYQSRGNMRFVRNASGVWEMQYDTWQTRGEVERVRDAFVVAYQAVMTSAYFSRFGYQQYETAPMENNQLVMIGAKRWG